MQQNNIQKKVVIGGTFDVLHKGHEALLSKAFELGIVTIGLTSDIMVKNTKNREVSDFESREKELKDFIIRNFKTEAEIIKIEDKYGTTLKEDFDYIVVSPETYDTAVLINQEREKRNKPQIEIIKINFVEAEDGKPISSLRISKGEIDKEGKLLYGQN